MYENAGIRFKVTAIEEIINSELAMRFEDCKRHLQQLQRTTKELVPQIGFHGTRQDKINSICAHGLLPHQHPLNRSRAVDAGWFGTPKYVYC